VAFYGVQFAFATSAGVGNWITDPEIADSTLNRPGDRSLILIVITSVVRVGKEEVIKRLHPTLTQDL